ncbi:MAG: hypothetical protein K8I82_03800 [Anaerolineae bacterium]|nr:hypothetical protein [Anaerolineae bacterium]
MEKPQSKICPYLGKSKVNPNQMLCGKLKPPSPIRTSYIKDYCVADYEQCSIYQGAPGRQSADDRSPLVMVPVAPVFRAKADESKPDALKMPVVEFMAYEELLPEDTLEKKENGRLWALLMLVGIAIGVTLAALIVFQFL